MNGDKLFARWAIGIVRRRVEDVSTHDDWCGGGEVVMILDLVNTLDVV